MNQTKLIESAKRVADSYAKIANKILGTNLSIPVDISFDLHKTEPKATGFAKSENKKHSIEINMVLFEDNIDYFLNDTIPHEIGHLCQYDKFDDKGKSVQGHGAEWRDIMKRLGKLPNKHHTLDLSRSIKLFKEHKKLQKSFNSNKEFISDVNVL